MKMWKALATAGAISAISLLSVAVASPAGSAFTGGYNSQNVRQHRQENPGDG